MTDAIIPRLAELLAWETESRKSIELNLETKIESTRNTGSDAAFDTIAEHFIGTATGQRLYDMQGELAGVPVWRSVGYADGNRFAEVHYKTGDLRRQNIISIRRQFWREDNQDRMTVPLPLLFLNVGHEPLQTALAKSSYLGKGEAVGRPCELFLFERVRWAFPQDHVYFLDEASAIPLKVVSFASEADRLKDKPIWIWSADSLKQVDGHLLPWVSKQVSLGPDGGPYLTNVATVESVSFDMDYPDSNFWPTFQPGVEVFDTLKGTREIVGNPDGVTPTVPSIATNPIASTLPSDWSLYAKTVSVSLGSLLILVAVMAWFRNRNSSHV